MKILCDSHIHSNNSFDASSTVEQLVLSAIKKGLSAVTITDHCEVPLIRLNGDCEEGNFNIQIPKSLSDVKYCQDIYKKKINIYSGIELGEPTQDIEGTEKALSYGKYDFILASLHNLKGEKDFYYLNYNRDNIGILLNKYFDELYETALFEHYDSLAHLTYPLRYIYEKTNGQVDLINYDEKINNILDVLVKSKKALEINTSGLFKKIGTTLPDANIIKRFKNLGGKYITIGSDAHCANALGNGIEQGLEVAKMCGFDYYTIYRKHEPQQQLIEI